MGNRNTTGRLWRTIRNWNEFYTIPLGLLLFIGTPRALRLIDGTAGSYDLSVLQPVAYAIATVSIIKGCAWWLFKLDFPQAYRWLDDGMEGEVFTERTPLWLKLAVTFGVFGSYLLLLVLLTLALLG